VSARQEIIDAFLNKPALVQLYRAEVVDVSGNWCTVRLLHSDLEVEGVSLVGEEDAGDRLVLQPKKGSLVLVGRVENDLGMLYVAQCGEIDGGTIEIGKTKITFDKSSVVIANNKSTVTLTDSKAVLNQGDTSLELANKKVKVTNGTVSLKTLFDDLTTLLNTLIVITPAGPSTALGPNSITAVASLKTKVSQLLS
jgi:hypothetical protein